MSLCLMFVAGFLVRGDVELLDSLGFAPLGASADANPGQTTTGSTYDSVSARVAEMEGVLQEDSLDSFDLEMTTNKLLTAFADSTSNSYVHYYNNEQYQNYLVEASKNYTGIGCLFGEYQGRCYVVDVFSGSDAQAQGVQVGDYIKAIDGVQKKWTLYEVVSALDRPKGSRVSVTWMRPDTLDAEEGSEFSVTLRCSPSDKDNVSFQLEDKVGYIKINQLTQNCDDYVKAALKSLQSQGAQAFVVDLRNNPGGYLTQAVNISSFFIKSGVIVKIQTKDGDSTKNATGDVVTDLPLVVMVNKHTAAASEVMAAALQDNKRAVLVGETTLGKGAVQVVRPFSFGGALRYTAARYISPSGHEINGIGIVPRHQIDQQSDADSQKMVALHAAESMIE